MKKIDWKTVELGDTGKEIDHQHVTGNPVYYLSAGFLKNFSFGADFMAEAEKRELFDKINHDLRKALKEKDELRLSVLRMMKSKILYINARGDLPDAELIKILTKYSKEIKESIDEFKKVGRMAEVERSEKELAMVQEYLPKELSPEEIKNIVQQAIQELGASSIKELGSVMKAVLAKQPGIDGKLVNQFVREILK